MSTSKPAPETRRHTVPAVARAAQLLNVLAATKEPMGLAALVKALQLPKSTVHGLCATLVDAGLLARFDNAYHLGVRIMDLAHAYLARTDITAEFVRILNSETPMPEESIVLSVLDGADIVYVACRNGSRPFGFNFRIGMRLPANCAASGKALLSTIPASRVEEFARSRAFYALTRKSVTKPAPLLKQLAQVRRNGYAIDDEETRHGMVCIGAPVFASSAREAVAAVAVSMPKAALDARRKAAAIETVKTIAAKLSQHLGAASSEAASFSRQEQPAVLPAHHVGNRL